MTWHLLIGLLWFQVGFSSLQPPLSSDEVWLIVMSTPAAIQLEARGGCAGVDIARGEKQLMYVQLRNMCPKSGTGLVDNFTIDTTTAQIWTGTDDRAYIDSERLRRLRRVFQNHRTGIR